MILPDWSDADSVLSLSVFSELLLGVVFSSVAVVSLEVDDLLSEFVLSEESGTLKFVHFQVIIVTFIYIILRQLHAAISKAPL